MNKKILLVVVLLTFFINTPIGFGYYGAENINVEDLGFEVPKVVVDCIDSKGQNVCDDVVSEGSPTVETSVAPSIIGKITSVIGGAFSQLIKIAGNALNWIRNIF